jgi:TraM recognition site of TraD and TraG
MAFLRVLIPKKDSEQDERKDTTRDFKEQVSLMEQLLASLKSLHSWGMKSKLFGQDYLSLEYVAHKQEIYFYVVVPKKAKNLIEKQISAFYPDAVIDQTDEIDIFEGKKSAKGLELVLSKSFHYPIKTYQKLESDPMNTLLSTLWKLGETEAASIQILLSPISDTWQNSVKKTEKHKKWKFSFNPLSWVTGFFSIMFSSPEDMKWDDSHENEDEDGVMKEKRKKTGYEVIIRIIATGDDAYMVESEMKNITSSFSQYSIALGNSFKSDKKTNLDGFMREYIFRHFPFSFKSKSVLNIEEIASIFHFPHTKYNKTPEIRWQNFKIVKAPVNTPNEWLLLGTNVYKGVTKEVRIKNEDRFRHFYIIGQTGVGKSSLIMPMARQDFLLENGCAIMDPHGELALDLLPFVPRERADDVIYFDPADMSRPMGVNILEATTDDEKQIVAQDAMNIMIKLFGPEIFGPRIQDYFRNGVLTLMDYPGGCALTDIMRLFTDDDFQKERRRTLKNPIVKAWWDFTFAKMGDREKGEIIPYFAAKFGGFITNTMMRNIIWQTKSSFDVFDVMQQKKLLFINLSKGTLGDINSVLIGMIMVQKIQMAALRRQNVAKEERSDFFLYIDEFQNYVTDSIESILSEARKYRLGLVIAHQYLGQLQKSDALTKSNLNLKDAIFGNVANKVCFRVGPEDADFIAKDFAPVFSNQDLVNIDNRKAVMRLCIDGQASSAFSLIPTNPYLQKGDPMLARAYKELSRLKYGRDREFIEKEIIFRIGA